MQGPAAERFVVANLRLLAASRSFSPWVGILLHRRAERRPST